MYIMHAIAIISSILYIVYEIGNENLHFIPVEFTMYFLLNMIAVWTFVLITREDPHSTNADGSSPFHIKVRNGFVAVLVFIYIISFFTGTLGVECARGTNSKGNWLLALFWILWSSYVMFALKDDEKLRLQSVTVSGLVDTTKETLFSREVKDFDEESMGKMKLT